MNTYAIKIIAAAASILFAGNVFAQDANAQLDQLLQEAREAASTVSKESQQRIDQFRRNRNQQAALLQQVKRQLAAAELRGDQLQASFEQNELDLENMNEQLRIQSGNMGELFGVVRQVSGDTKGTIDSSLISAQYPDRGEIASQLAQIKGLPSIEELNQLRMLMLDEMVESAKVVRYPTTIVNADGSQEQTEVVRVGVFNVITGDRFLSYEPQTRSLKELPRQPVGRYRSLASDLYSATDGIVAMAVDPSFGSLLALLIDAPNAKERVDQGGLVGYVILVLGLIGLLISIERLLFLQGASTKIRQQLKSDTPDPTNALGRILSVYTENKTIDAETLELKLDEAILRETPQFEKRQGTIKVLAAVAPLLGLLGTVVGMIATFQMITLFGTGDPKLMAGGISQALVTTMLGLVVAIPLVLLHSLVASKSKALIEILEEQSAGIIAKHSEQDTFV